MPPPPEHRRGNEGAVQETKAPTPEIRVGAVLLCRVVREDFTWRRCISRAELGQPPQ